LPQLDSRGGTADKKAPCVAVNRPGLDMRPQGGRNERFQRLKAFTGITGEPGKLRQHGGGFCGLHERDGMMAAIHWLGQDIIKEGETRCT